MHNVLENINILKNNNFKCKQKVILIHAFRKLMDITTKLAYTIINYRGVFQTLARKDHKVFWNV